MKHAIITGAGSGAGRGIAQAMAREGWTLALFGRRESALTETLRSLPADAQARAQGFPLDIGDQTAVNKAVAELIGAWGHVDVLVNNAGTNTPKRSLRDLSDSDYQLLINTNLHGAYYCTQAVLPAMRARQQGTIVNIGSLAGISVTSGLAGVAYAMSKFGLNGLSQAINAEERTNGIRSVHIAPGEINSEILLKRPTFVTDERRAKMLQPEDIAACVMLAVNLPQHAIVEQMVITPK
jgi:NADP-dependent 3-hydroxy acid dehydrogenase YdfG